MTKWLPRRLKDQFSIILLLSGYIFLQCCVIPYHMRDRVYSMYFTGESRRAELTKMAYDLNMVRLQDAEYYINSIMDLQERIVMKNTVTVKKGPAIVIGVITTQRPIEKESNIRTGYLIQTLATLHRLSLKNTFFKKIEIVICNVDKFGEAHNEATYMSTLFQTHVKYKQNEEGDFIEGWQIYEKEKVDYAYCLQQSYRSDYIVMLEDDALPNDDFFQTLEKITAQYYFTPTVTTNWAFMKLYYPQRWAGYGANIAHWIELFGISLFGGITNTIAAYFIQSCILRTTPLNKHQLIIFILGMICSILMAESIGRPYVISLVSRILMTHWLVKGEGCCTQATMFSSENIIDVINYLNTKSCDVEYPVDMALDDFAAENSLHQLLVEPNIVTHIGLFSSLKLSGKDPAEYI